MKKDFWWNETTPAESTKTEPPITGMLIQSDEDGEIPAVPAQWMHSVTKQESVQRSRCGFLMVFCLMRKRLRHGVKQGGLGTRRLEGLRTPPKSAPERGSYRAGGRRGMREVSRAEANTVEASAWARLATERGDQAPLVKLADEASHSFCCNIACNPLEEKGFIEPSSWKSSARSLPER